MYYIGGVPSSQERGRERWVEHASRDETLLPKISRTFVVEWMMMCAYIHIVTFECLYKYCHELFAKADFHNALFVLFLKDMDIHGLTTWSKCQILIAQRWAAAIFSLFASRNKIMRLVNAYLCISVMIYLFQFSISVSHMIYIWVRDLTLAVRVSLRMLGTWKSLIVLSMHLLEPILGTGWSASAHQYQVPQKLSTAWSLLHEPWTWRFTLLGSSRVEKGLGDMFNSAICHCKVS